ncbi:Dicer-like protein 1 [Coemansia sp. RSA 988]|nr:Dicer-like protein 1 [Coemansia sp. RSA 988]
MDRAASDCGGGSSGSGDTIATPILNTQTPRDYQLSLFKQALTKNSIVMLETGTGKTLVAVMLIEWFAQRAESLKKSSSQSEKRASHRVRKKVRVFLNNTVALVHQQSKVIAANTGQKVQEYVGSMGIDEWDEATWSSKWNSASVLVMTHQVLLNALRSGHVKFSDIDLLVFDECHHARGDHPYALIMREFYDQCSEEDRPHIFGMTASPLNSHQTAEGSIMHLQAMLDSRICTVDLTANADVSLSTSTGICYEYKLPPTFKDTPLTIALVKACGNNKVVIKGLSAVSTILPLLGPFGVDQMWHYYIQQWHRSTIQRPAPSRNAIGTPFQTQSTTPLSSQLQTSVESTQSTGSAQENIEVDCNSMFEDEDMDADIHLASGPGTPVFDVEMVLDKPTIIDAVVNPFLDLEHLKQAMDIDRNHGGIFMNEDFQSYTSMTAQHAAVSHPIPHVRALFAARKPWSQIRSMLSPQVNRLLGILHQWHDKPDNLRGIVFTERRITAVLLVFIISQISEFDFVKADALLGAAQKAGNNIDRPIRGGSVRTANQLTLTDFSEGRLNLIFATQVAEEGVDIQPCNVVIRFDMPKTAISLIQSRGRARMADSQFIIMVPEVSVEQKLKTGSGDPKDGLIISPEDDDAGLYDNMIVDPDAVDSDDEMLEMRRPLPEHVGTYTDYLKLVNLEKCLREWCRDELQSGDGDTSVGVITSNHANKEYNRLLLDLRKPLQVDDSPDTDLKETWVEQSDQSGRIYTVVASQARITYLSAISIVYCYVQRLPQDLFCNLIPQFDIEKHIIDLSGTQDTNEPNPSPDPATATKKKKKSGPAQVNAFRCIITFPSNAAIRQVTGPQMPNKKLAKQAAAYRAAKKLHQLGAIDDNLAPVVDAKDELTLQDEGSLSQKGDSKTVKGARSSVKSYPIAVPLALIPPISESGGLADSRVDSGVKLNASPSVDDSSAGPKGMCQMNTADTVVTASVSTTSPCNGPSYCPFVWHIYLVPLMHPLSPEPTYLALVTANQLPDDVSVPLYLNQFAKTDGAVDTSATNLSFHYLGSQMLDESQVESLASFSSAVLMRVLKMALSWDIHEVGCLLAPVLDDFTGIDFDFAEYCFADRSVVYSGSTDDYSDIVDTLVLDRMDGGHLKIIEGICDDLDLYSDLRSYYAQANGINGPAEPIPSKKTSKGAQTCNTDATSSQSTTPTQAGTGFEQRSPEAHIDSSKSMGRAPSESPLDESQTTAVDTPTTNSDANTISDQPVRLKRVKYRKPLEAVKTLADWAEIKYVDRMRPSTDVGSGVPLFKVKYAPLVLNYLSIIPVLAAAGQPKKADKDPNPFTEGRFASPFFCAQEFMTLADVNNLSLLPSFFTRIDNVLLATEVKSRLGLPAEVETVRMAITSGSASSDMCYERLETLGDSVLKYITSVMLFVTYPDAHEGILTSRRKRIICNANLFELSCRLNLPPYIITQTFSRRDVRLPGRGWNRLPFIPQAWIATSEFEKPHNTADSEQKTARSSPQSQETSNPNKPKPKTRVVVKERNLGDKTVADIIESLLGACVNDSGIDGALIAARALGVVDSSWTSWSSFAKVWRSNLAARKQKMKKLHDLRTEAISSNEQAEEGVDLLHEMELDKSDILFSMQSLDSGDKLSAIDGSPILEQLGESQAADIEAVLGYKFKVRTLLIEALTHCSSLDLASNSYQRLEFLGDALLDFFVTKRYYDYQPPLSPHRITLVKHIAVSNDLFAVILVCLGLHKHLRHNSVVIRDAISDYENRLSYARNMWAKRHKFSDSEDLDIGRGVDDMDIGKARTTGATDSTAPAWETEEDGHRAKRRRVSQATKSAIEVYKDLPPECWNVVQAPKILGDLFESLFGAVYLDSGMKHKAIKRVYERLLTPFLDQFVDTGKLSLNPVMQSLLVCQGWGCTMITWESTTNANLLDFMVKYSCDVKVHGQTLCTGVGESSRQAKFNASTAFLEKIGATAPNALDGDLKAANNLPKDSSATEGASESILDKLLKPICDCGKRRQTEAAARAAEEEQAKAKDVNMVEEAEVM